MAMSQVQMRASTADRERAIGTLKSSFVEGRLTQEELELRVGHVLTARLFPDVIAHIADLPAGPFGRLPAHPVTPAFPRTSRLAVAGLICAVAAPGTLGISAIPAILLGCAARRRIARTGEKGSEAAIAALVLGSLALLGGLVVVAVWLAS